MHLSGIGQAVYGPQLPCCPDAASATRGVLENGVPCDPNCLEGYTPEQAVEAQQKIIEEYRLKEGASSKTSSQWFSGVSNSAVILVAVGLGAIFLFRGSR
jgi:hypothetical protein